MAWQDTREAMAAFVDRHGLSMPTAVDEDQSLFGRFGFSYQPAWAFIAADGSVRLHPGPLDEPGLVEALEGLAA